MWCISIAMCYLDRFIYNINYSLQDFLITFFELLAWIVLIIGAIDTFPQNKYSNKRVWFYYYGGIHISNPFFYRINKHIKNITNAIPSRKFPYPHLQYLNVFVHEISKYDSYHH